MSKRLSPPQVYAPDGYPSSAPAYHQGHHPPAPGYHQAPSAQWQQPGPQNTQVFAPVLNQPQTQTTSVVVNTGSSAKSREWSTPLCGCMEDVTTSLCTIFCLSCVLCGLATRMGECVCMPFLVPQSIMAMRINVRAANKINGSICSDFYSANCCPLLSLCQLKRELDNIDKRKPSTEL